MLLDSLRSVQSGNEVATNFVWWHNNSGFSITDIYVRMNSLCNSEHVLDKAQVQKFSILWKNKVPRKVLFFRRDAYFKQITN